MIENITKQDFLILTEKETRKNVVICALFNDDEQIALFKRSDDDNTNPSLWGLIGGGVDSSDESFQKALSREIKEEAGVTLSNFKFVRTFTEGKTMIHVYTKKIGKFNPTLNDEHSDWDWFDTNDLPSPGFDNNKENIKACLECISDKEKLNEGRYHSSMESVEEYARNIGVDPDDLDYLGSGDFGEAYSTGDGRVIKLTSSKSEPELAKNLMERPLPNLVKIYDVRTLKNGMSLILMEELDTDSEIEDKFWVLFNIVTDADYSFIYEFGNFDFEEYAEENPDFNYDEYSDFINDLNQIFRSYRILGASAPDVSTQNLGYNKEGELTAFDIHDRAINEESVLKESRKVYQITESQLQVVNGSLMNEEYPKNWDINHFKSLTSFKARVKYVNEVLGKPYGIGSSRRTYLIDNEKVLKLAFNKKGLEQNKTEITSYVNDNFLASSGLLTKIFNYNQDGLWLEAERATKITESDFKKIVGISIDDLSFFTLSFLAQNASSSLDRSQIINYRRDLENPDNMNRFKTIEELVWDEDNESPFLREFIDLVMNYDGVFNFYDFFTVKNLGKVIRDGEETIVIIDYGLDTDTWDNYYTR